MVNSPDPAAATAAGAQAPAQTPTPPPEPPTNEAEKQRESNRSAVRMIVTYVAAGFLFVVGAAISGYFIAIGQHNEGKDIFFSILPIAAAVVTYWFATRQNDAAKPENMIKLIKAARGE